MEKPPTPKIVRLKDKTSRCDLMHRYTFTGWNYEGGWLVASQQLHPKTAIFANTVNDFYAVSRASAGEDEIEIRSERIELTDKERAAILGVAWDWEIGEPMVKNGTCVVQSLAKAMDLTIENVVEMFRNVFRDPQVKSDVIEVLEQNNYKVHSFGGEDFGYRERRRIVFMRCKTNHLQGHAVLVYENDESVFDPDDRFKTIESFMFARNLGYELDGVLVIDKVNPGE